MTDSVNYTGKKKQGLAIACLICGILAILLSELLIGILFGIVGLILGIVRWLQRPDKKGMLISGMVLSFIGIGLGSIFAYLYFTVVIPAFKKQMAYFNTSGTTHNINIQSLPGPPVLDLNTLTTSFTTQTVWNQSLPNGEAMAIGDWDLNGSPDIEVVISGSALKIFNLQGSEIGNCLLPQSFSLCEYGYLPPGQPVLLGYSNWGSKVSVINTQGKEIWSYNTPHGVDGAHWGDLDRDGFSEMIVGFNGSGGLHAVNYQGYTIWKDTQLGNVWNQAIISSSSTHQGMVLCSEAMGSIRIFDPQGHQTQSLQPLGQYACPLDAVDVDGNGNIQIATQIDVNQNQNMNLVIDTQGNALWKCLVNNSNKSWREPTFAHGDLDGDGIQDWVFLHKPDELVIISGKGQYLTSVPVSAMTKHFAIITRPQQAGLLCVMDDNHLIEYEINTYH